MMNMNRPILGITMGDPFGNGPEITVRALHDKTVYDRCRPLVVGDVSSMEYALRVAKKVSGIDLALNPVRSVQDAKFAYGTIDVLDMGLVPKEQIPDTADQEEPKPFGIGACALGGEASFQYVKKVIELAMAGEIDATVTNALSKEAINMAGHHYSGHTEIYADYTHTDKYTIMCLPMSLCGRPATGSRKPGCWSASASPTRAAKPWALRIPKSVLPA